MKKLCFGTFAQIIRLCKRENLTDYELVGTMTRTIDPDCQYANKNNSTQVSRLFSCEGNLSDGRKSGGSGAYQKPGDSISKVRLLAPKADKNEIIQKFDENVIPLIDEDKKTLAILALLDIIRDDMDLDGDKHLTFEKYVGKTKKALLLQGEFILADLLAGLFLYTIIATKNTIGKTCIKEITEEYIKKFACKTNTIKTTDTFKETEFNKNDNNQTEYGDPYVEDTTDDSFSKATENKSVAFNQYNQYGNNNVQIKSVNTLTLNYS